MSTEAERKAGELLAGLQKDTGGRGPAPKGSPPATEAAGLSEYTRVQEEANIDERALLGSRTRRSHDSLTELHGELVGRDVWIRPAYHLGAPLRRLLDALSASISPDSASERS